ncbi:hypothetical protein [Pyxidicoccus sp. MSG2]|uniref:hypothetical protein n=1 Tax=Pyxidicoccus sp. MSG2 TaxID=2996790 RepID=UPI0022702317|nr:hypothetical protein [Pyxidicoccus sp. MSG2]MCY1023967.1 hypothetical protein [Pyxidicoccus sp. MSG2]
MAAALFLLPLLGLALGLVLRPHLGAWAVRLALFLCRSSPSVVDAVQRQAFREVLQRSDVTAALLERELKETAALLERSTPHERTRPWSHLQAVESHRARLAQALAELRSPKRSLTR